MKPHDSADKAAPCGWMQRLVRCSSSLVAGFGQPSIVNLLRKWRDELHILGNEYLPIRSPHVVSCTVRAGINLNAMSDIVMIRQNLTTLSASTQSPPQTMGILDSLTLRITNPNTIRP